MRHVNIARFLLLAVFAAQSFAQSEVRFANSNADIERVFDLIDARLALMPEVAAAKWRAGQPIVDTAREQAVLDRTLADAGDHGLEGAASQRFMQAQILLARIVQERVSASWRSGQHEVPRARDVATVLRPELDRIAAAQWPALYLAASELAGEPAAPRIQEALDRLLRHGLTRDQLAPLRTALTQLRYAETLSVAQVRRIGVLRVGTTGDYEPFSLERDGELSGFDVRLAQELARAWNVRVKFIRTSWPTLMADLTRRHFDVAMSGISVTAERLQHADFSLPYHTDGKTPIARCAEVRQFHTLEQIDRPGVRVIVNPGGTNERYVRDHIRKATIVVHPDNRTIFEQISAGRADVMITDGIEVTLQSSRHPTLCGTGQAPFTVADKAILWLRGSDLKRSADVWLAPRLQRQELKVWLQAETVRPE